MKINARSLFMGNNDVRKHCSVDMHDSLKQTFADELGISFDDVEMILRNAEIFINLTKLPDEINIEVEEVE